MKACKQENIALIHISTDYVFNSEKEDCDEDDRKAPVNYDGKTKTESEEIIANDYDKYYIIRTS